MARDNSAEFGRRLIETGQCDYLIKTNGGDLAYDIAFRTITDLELTALVEEKTIEQANKKGLDTNNLFKHQQDGYWGDDPKGMG